MLCVYLLRCGLYTAIPTSRTGPIDVIAYDELGSIYFFDAKKKTERTTPGSFHRRKRTLIQRRLGVINAYVDIITGDVVFEPYFDLKPTIRVRSRPVSEKRD